MSSRNVVPPPYVPPDALLATDTNEWAYRFVKFNGEEKIGSVRADLLVGLRNMPESLLIFELFTGWRDIYVLFRIKPNMEAESRLEGWIDRMAGQRIYHSVYQGWVRIGDQMIRFCK